MDTKGGNMKELTVRARKRRQAGVTLILPATMLLMICFAIPLVYAVLISFSSSNAVMAQKIDFVGIKNYVSILTNSRFREALFHTLFFTVTTIILEFIIGFAVSLLLYTEVPGFRFFKLIMSLPLMVAPVVSGLQWRWLFADQYGVINYILKAIGINPPLWFTTANGSWVTIIVANLWLATPFVILVLLAGLGGLSENMNEAARIDGANGRQIFFRIMLPQLKPTILIILVIRLSDALRIYDLIYILTGGGPGGKTEVLSTYIYKRIFTDLEFGKGQAASFVVMILIAAISFACNKLMEEKE